MKFAKKMKEKRKIKRIRIDVLLTEDRYQELMRICGDFKTITEGINESIDWRYGFLYGNNNNNTIQKATNNKNLINKEEQEWESYKESLELEKMKEARRLRKGKVIDDE